MRPASLEATLQAEPKHSPPPLSLREMPAPLGRMAEASTYHKPSSAVEELSLPEEIPSKTDPILISAGEIKTEQLPDLSGNGHADIELLISPGGRVVKLSLVETDLPEEYLTAVKQTFETARFVPGTQGKTPVYAKFRMRIAFGGASGEHPLLNAGSGHRR